MKMLRYRRPMQRGSHPGGPLTSQGPDLLAATWTLRLVLWALRRPGAGRDLVEDAAKLSGMRDAWVGNGMAGLTNEAAALAEVRDLGSAKAGPLVAQLVAQLRTLEKTKVDRSKGLLRNADVLARELRLTRLERDLMVLSVMTTLHPSLNDGLSHGLGTDRVSDFSRNVACALGAKRADVRRVLRKDGAVRSTKLVVLLRDREDPLTPAPELVAALLSQGASSKMLLSHFLRESAATHLRPDDFSHVEADLTAITRLVKGALGRRATGVNILLHGRPGTGKTELARVVSRTLGARLYEVADSDEDEDALEGDRRLAMCAVAHRVLGRSERALLLFDEIEDAFPSRWQGSLGLERESTPSKSWTHRLLEQSPVPTFWIANEIRQMDPATLRRFDLVVELGVPPTDVRRRMIVKGLRRTELSPARLDRLAADERLAPAHLSRAVRVTGLMGVRRAEDVEAALTYVLDRNLATQGPAQPVLSAAPGCGPYDVSFVNASTDLVGLADSLAGASQAAICLYGPPGTGKTAWVTHLAARVGRPLRAARASDLMDCWVGGTEKNIAALFRSAAKEKALLFLDEADSFLQERSRAKQSWEVTQVNELLVQMETFPGIFVCATNLVDSLDQASLRRFAVKVEFLPLRPEQRWAMFQRLAGEAEAGLSRSAIDRLHGLTAGDFATVARQLRLVASASGPKALVTMLERELVLRKGGGGRTIGFG